MAETPAWDGTRLRAAREARGWTGVELAAKMGATKSQVSQWELGLRTPGADSLIRLRAALGVSADQLLGGGRMTAAYVLIQASDCTLNYVFTGATRGALAADVTRQLNEEIKAISLPWSEGNQGYVESGRDAFLRMIAEHQDWAPGVHEVALHVPLWEPVYLVVVG